MPDMLNNVSSVAICAHMCSKPPSFPAFDVPCYYTTPMLSAIVRLCHEFQHSMTITRARYAWIPYQSAKHSFAAMIRLLAARFVAAGCPLTEVRLVAHNCIHTIMRAIAWLFFGNWRLLHVFCKLP